MSKYSLNYLRNASRVGDVAKNGLPWTARALGLTLPGAYEDKTADGAQWLYEGAVPLTAVRALLEDYAVVSHPLSFIRPAMPWDDPSRVITFDGQPYTVVTDETRQVIADAKTDRVHFVPRDGYQVHDAVETAIERTARIVGESSGDLHVDSVLVLADGAEFSVSISTDGLISTPEGVDFYPHILAAGSHNGTLASTLAACCTLTVCDNTKAVALSEGRSNGTMSKVKHTRMSANRLEKAEDEAREALGLIVSAGESMAAEIKRLCEITVTDEQWSTFVQTLAPITDDTSKNGQTRAEKSRELWTSLYRGDARASQWQGTAFGALQAVNTADLWERGTRGGTDEKARIVREAITGKSAERDAQREAALMRVLAGATV